MSESHPRPDLDEVLRLRAAQLDAARPDAVAKRRKLGRLTARENIDRFLDPGSFVEYGRVSRPLRRDMEGAADGVVMGTGTADGHPACVMAYDYTVHAGTQSFTNHRKTDRIFHLAAELRAPMVCWLEGGGARPHDMPVSVVQSETATFVAYARLSGLVPTVGIVAGRSFAGNANLAGACDLLIATPDASLGMAGPPLVEAALGKRLTPEEIGPVAVHVEGGVVDLLVDDEGAAAAAARRYLGFFRGRRPAGASPDPARLRDVVPDNPRRAYDVRKVIELLADDGTALELRPRFGRAAVTALAFVGGHPVGFVANQPMVQAGAIDSPASDKIARFVQLCDAHDLPVVCLADTPGLMVGPEVEKTALVRHSARILAALANATVPILTVVLRKGYGLGYYVMGSRPLDPVLLVAWPTAEFGGMGLEGAVNIIHKAALDAAPDAETRARLHAGFTADLRRINTALETAGRFEVDDVIDPADTRAMLLATLDRLPVPPPRAGRKRVIDAW
ncbi:MAG TPA: carboxyl transferase domain-containing protein [Haliangiales bacterium]|nr:carboxyl transferase domain-containing protein [Haliangiales bacterium]